MTAPLCFVDTETDGVHPGRKPWEVALIRRETDGRETEEHFFLAIDLSTADPFGLRVGRFYDRHPLGRRISHPTTAGSPKVRPITSAIPLIARMTHGAHIVGAVPNFDTEILERILRENGLAPAWHYHLIDIENLAVGYLAAHSTASDEEKRQLLQPPWSSDALTRALGLPATPDEDRHTALGDARWARAVYDRVMEGAPA